MGGGAPSSNLHRQLFGENCEKEDEAAYLKERSYGERKLIDVQVAASEEMLRVWQGKATEEEVLEAQTKMERQAAQIEAEGADGLSSDSSLMQLEALTQSTGDKPIQLDA